MQLFLGVPEFSIFVYTIIGVISTYYYGYKEIFDNAYYQWVFMAINIIYLLPSLAKIAFIAVDLEVLFNFD